jgi:hypothetical protein
LLGMVADVALVSLDVVPVVVAVPYVPLVVEIPALVDIVPLPLICIGGHGFTAVVLPVVVCCAFAAAAIAAVSASDKVVARHRDTR